MSFFVATAPVAVDDLVMLDDAFAPCQWAEDMTRGKGKPRWMSDQVRNAIAFPSSLSLTPVNGFVPGARAATFRHDWQQCLSSLLIKIHRAETPILSYSSCSLVSRFTSWITTLKFWKIFPLGFLKVCVLSDEVITWDGKFSAKQLFFVPLIFSSHSASIHQSNCAYLGIHWKRNFATKLNVDCASG